MKSPTTHPARQRTKKHTKSRSGLQVEALEARIAPAATVTLSGSFANDADGDGEADPGDRIHYTATIDNASPSTPITLQSFTEIANDPNLILVPGSLNVSPLASDDVFTGVRNTLLRVGGTQGSEPEVFVSGDVDTNDFEFLGDTFTVVPIVNGTTANGGTVNLNADGTFTYLPAAGFTGASDTFTYTITDDGTAVSGALTGTGTVTINFGAQEVWYVDPTFAGTSDGRSTNPFKTLAAVSGSTGPDGTGDIIYLNSGTYTDTITLLGSQTLHGENSELVVDGFTLAAAGTAPVIAPGSGTAVTLATGNTLTGFTVGNAGVDISGNNFGTLRVSNLTLEGTGKALNLVTGTVLGIAGFNSISGSGSASEGLLLQSVTGTINIGSTTISTSAGAGIFVTTSSATISFGNTSVTDSGGDGIRLENNPNADLMFPGTVQVTNAGNIGFHHTNDGGTTTVGGATTITNSTSFGLVVQGTASGNDVTFANVTESGSGNTGVLLGQASTPNAANVTFAALNIAPDSGQTALSSTNGTGTITTTSGVITATGAGSAILINGPAAMTPLSLTLTSVSGAGGTNNIRLSNVSGTANLGTGTLAGATGAAFLVGDGSGTANTGGTAAITYNGTITTTGTARAVDIQDRRASAGNISLGGQITHATGNASVIFLDDNAAGTITFSGANSVLNGGTANAVQLTDNTGATITFSGNNTTISTTSGTGFNATGGGTINVTGSGNTISSTTGTALNIVNTTIGASDVTFQAISANGANSGIVLNNTGTSGELIVTGTGSAGSGGTLQATASHAISLTSTKTPSFSSMNITNTGGDGINASSLTAGFTLSGLQLLNIGNSDNENGITMTNVGGTVSIQGTSINNVVEEMIEVTNVNTDLVLNIGTVTASTFTQPNTMAAIRAGGAFAGNGVLITSSGSSNISVNVSNSTFTDIKGFGFQFGSTGSGSANTSTGSNNNITLNNNDFLVTITNQLDNSGTAGVDESANNRANTINVQGLGSIDIDASVINNLLDGGGGGGIQFGADNSANVSATIDNNDITDQFADGILAAVDEAATLTLLINNNRISNTSSDGMEIANDLGDNVGEPEQNATLNVTITNNTVNNTNTNAGNNAFFAGIGVFGGSTPGDVTFVNITGNTVGGSPASSFDYAVDGSSFGDAITVQGAGTGAVAEADFLAAPAPQNTANSPAGQKTFIGNAFYSNGVLVPLPTFTALLFAPGQPEPAIDAPVNETPVVTPPVVGNPPAEQPPVIVAPPTVQAPVIIDDGILSQAELDSLVAAAIARWQAAGLTAEQMAILNSVVFTVADLPGRQLGEAGHGRVTLDMYGAGNAWFIDATPLDDAEFAGTGTQLFATATGGAKTRVDALTTLMHELGHQLGLEDSVLSSDAADLMYGYLTQSERRLPAFGQAERAEAHAHDGAHTLQFSPTAPSLGGVTLPVGKSITIVYDGTVKADLANGLAPTVVTSQISVTHGDGTLFSNSVTFAVDSLSIGNQVFNDVNRNGIFDAGDTGINGVALSLFVDANNDNIPDGAAIASMQTAGDGNYAFLGLLPGNYIVRVDSGNFASGQPLFGLLSLTGAIDPDNNDPDTDNDDNGVDDANPAVNGISSLAITLAYNTEPSSVPVGTDINFTLDFGFVTANSVGDRVWFDGDGDGVQDAGEGGLNGVIVELLNSGGTVIGTTTTAGDGNYTFGGLLDGSYSVRVSALPGGATATYDLDGIGTPQIAGFTLSGGQNRTDVDFGYRGNSSIGDRVWNDIDSDGVQDAGESGFNDVTVELLNTDGSVIATTTTTTDGNYTFGNLFGAAQYSVRLVAATLPAGVTPTYDLDGIGTPHIATFTLAIGQLRTDVDFGYTTPPTLQATLESGNLTISDVGLGGRANNLAIYRVGTDLVISDTTEKFITPVFGTLSNASRTLTIPLSQVTGSITFNTAGGTDIFYIDLSGGDFINAGGLIYNAGESESDSDNLTILGYVLDTADGVADVTVNHTGPEAGDVVLAGLGTVSFTQTEPLWLSGIHADLVFNLPATTNSATLGDDDTTSNQQSRLSGATFERTDFLNPRNSLTINRGSAGDTLTVNSAPDLTSSLFLGTSAAPFSAITISGSLPGSGILTPSSSLSAFASGNLSITTGTVSAGGNILLEAGGNVSIAGNLAKTYVNPGTFTIRAGNNISITDGADITSASSQLDIVLNANSDGIGSGAILVDAGSSLLSNGGNITLGGGADPATTSAIGNATLPWGILINSATLSSGAGAITLNGQGAANAATNNSGVHLVSNSIVQTTSGDITITGQGGSLGSLANGIGIQALASVTSDAGDISLTGTGGSATAGGTATGVEIIAASVSTAGTGTLTVLGTGGNGTTNDRGVALFQNGRFQVENGTLDITGQATSGNTAGVLLSAANSGRLLATGSGPIIVKGTGFGTGNGFEAGASSIVGGATATGNIDIIADRIDLSTGTPSVQTTGTVTFKQQTAGRAINVGGLDSGTTLGLTDAELNRVTAPTVQIGDTSSGAITVTGTISPANYQVLSFGKDMSFATESGFSSDAFSATNYERIVVAGSVNITPNGVNLSVTAQGGYVPAPSDIFTIINNTSAAATTGTFQGRPEGASVPVGGQPRTITYVGGTGNDVVLVGDDLLITKTDNSENAVPGSTITYTVVASNSANSSQTATGATVSDMFDLSKLANVTLSAITPAGGASSGATTGTVADGNFTDTVNLPAGGSITYTFTATVIASATGTLTNIATITAPAGFIENASNNTATDTDILTGQFDLAISKTDSPDPVIAGQNITYTINLAKSGPSDAAGVVISDVLPAGLTFVSATLPSGWTLNAPAVGSNGTVTFTKDASMTNAETPSFTIVAKVASNVAQGTVISNTASVDSAGTDTNEENDDATATTTVNTQTNIEVTKSDSSDPIVAGTNQTYTITVTNSGSSDAQSVNLSDVLPAGTKFVSLSTPGGWSATTPAVGANGEITASIPTLAAGASATFTLVASVDSNVVSGTIISNTASATTTTTESDAEDNSATSTTTVNTDTDVSVSKTGSVGTNAGENVTYTITVTNSGPSDALSVNLSDVLPAGTTFVSLSSPGGWSATTPAIGANGTITATIPSLASGATATFTLVLDTDSSLAAGTSFINTATATTTSPDRDAANNSDSIETGITRLVDLAVTKTDTPDPVNAGANVTYTITITNNGPSDAANVNLTDVLPANMTFVSATFPDGGWSGTTPAVGASGTFSGSTASLPAGASAMFTIVARVNSDVTSGTIIENTASVGSDTEDSTPGNNSATSSTFITTQTDLEVTKVASDAVAPGANITYTITLTNTGPSNAQTVVLTDILPAGTTLVSAIQTSGPTFTLGGDSSMVLFSAPNFAANATATFTIIIDSGTIAAGTTVSNTASVSTSTPELDTEDNTSSDTTLIGGVNLSVTKENDNNDDIVVPGETITYRIGYANNGFQNAPGVVLTETLPAGTTFIATGSTAGWTETALGSGVYTLTLGTLNGTGTEGGSGSGEAIFIVGVVGTAPAGLDSIENETTISYDNSQGPDTDAADNTATDSDTLNAAPDLTVTKTNPLVSVPRGNVLQYTINYSNAGNQNATGVVLRETLPAGTTFNDAASSEGWTLDGGQYVLVLGNVTAGTNGTVTFGVTVNSEGPDTINNTVTIADDNTNGTEPETEDNTASLSKPIYKGIYAVGPGNSLLKRGPASVVRVFDIATGTEIHNFMPYGGTYRDTVRLAIADMNDDGFDDIITGTRAGTGRVSVFDGLTGDQFEGVFAQLNPFNGKSDKGAFLAAGDVTGDGRPDIVVGGRAGLKVYDGVSGLVIQDIKPFGKKFTGGVRVAVGDIDGDGGGDVVVSQSDLGHIVRVYDGASSTVLQQFTVGNAKYRGGVAIATADLDDDGRDDIIAGRNLGRPTVIEVFSGANLQPLGASITPFGANYRYGVRVATADVNGDGVADIIAAAGDNGNSQVRFYDGITHAEITALAFNAFPVYPKAPLFVAGSRPMGATIQPA